MATRTAPATTLWQIDPAHTLAEFAVKHMVFATVKGRFVGVSGRIELDEAERARSRAVVTLDAATISTGDEQRDAHLRSPDFFDVGTYPNLEFRTRRIEEMGDTSYRVIGDLTIRDVTREIVLDTEFTGRGTDPFGNNRIGFSARGVLNRSDYGLTWNAALEAGGVLVGDEIRIVLEVQAISKKA